jgi:hypothetical protein
VLEEYGLFIMLLDEASSSLDIFGTMKRNVFLYLTAALFISCLTSCLPLAAGAAAGYVAHDQGVRVRNPITKEAAE